MKHCGCNSMLLALTTIWAAAPNVIFKTKPQGVFLKAEDGLYVSVHKVWNICWYFEKYQQNRDL